MTQHCVFVTGATGYMGRALITALLRRGHAVRALARKESTQHVPAGAETVVGNALEPGTFADKVAPADTLVHLVGTPHPSPAKAASFRAVDLPSVAQPAPVMQAYIAVRREADARIRASGIPATILRPWYVLGPGHRWPCLLVPFYALAALLPPLRETALRLGLVTIAQMVSALVASIERGPQGVRILDVPLIRAANAQ
ncbi:MAG: SDR family oxidoreductase [Burkholderiales bacterium]